MAVNPKDLAEAINDAFAVPDKEGKKIKVTKEMILYATAILTTLQTSAIFHPPGTVKGPDNAMLATNGVFLPPLNPQARGGLTGSIGPATKQEATLSCGYLQGATQLIFGTGDIQGTNTATGSSSGPLANGRGSGGKVSNISASDWAATVTAPFGGDPVLSKRVFQAIIDYLVKNGELLYVPGGVTGTFSAPGTPIIAGTGSGGLLA